MKLSLKINPVMNNGFDLEARGNLGNDGNLSISLFFIVKLRKNKDLI